MDIESITTAAIQPIYPMHRNSCDAIKLFCSLIVPEKCNHSLTIRSVNYVDDDAWCSARRQVWGKRRRQDCSLERHIDAYGISKIKAQIRKVFPDIKTRKKGSLKVKK